MNTTNGNFIEKSIPDTNNATIKVTIGRNESEMSVANFATAIAPPAYKIYTALLTQTGVAPPVATVLENTIGNISFTYDGIGAYLANSNGLFTLNKTFSIIGTSSDGSTSNLVGILSNYSNNTILITSGDAVNGIPSNEFLQNTPIEIRVYN